MYPEYSSLRIHISIMSTMIIDGWQHGIRPQERKVQPHENISGIDIAKLNHFAVAVSSTTK